MSVKVRKSFADKYREFCISHCLQIGRFTEQVLSEVMEDYYFGRKAQQVLSSSTGSSISHGKLAHLLKK